LSKPTFKMQPLNKLRFIATVAKYIKVKFCRGLDMCTDWWIFGATIFAGIMAAIATFFAVIYSNKKTAEDMRKIKNQI